MHTHRLIILGSGPAGWTAALYAARAGLSPVVVTGSEPGGQLMTTTDVDNWPGDVEGLMGPDLMSRMEAHAKRFGTEVIFDHIHSVDASKRPFVLIGENDTYRADALIVATGATARFLGLEAEEVYKGRGVSACATCDGFFFKGEDVAVVGGGNVAVEEALYLSHMARKVYLVHRRDTLRAEKILQEKLFRRQQDGKIEIIWNHAVGDILGDDEGVHTLALDGTQGSGRVLVPVKGVFMAIGHTPNTSIFEGVLEMNKGYILTKGRGEGSTHTSIPGIFAAGDVADPIYRQAITSAGSGCQAALDAEKFLDGR